MIVSKGMSCDVLDWWKANSARFLLIAKAANLVFLGDCCPGSELELSPVSRAGLAKVAGFRGPFAAESAHVARAPIVRVLHAPPARAAWSTYTAAFG